jgi:steroid delta-isomerase-like uncharacterized protein
MANKYKTVVHEWFEEVWNQRKAETIDRLLAPGTIVHGIVDETGKEPQGPAEFRAFHKKFLEAFPDLSVEVLDTVSEGNKIACRCVVHGTHEGDSLGFAATGKNVEFTGMAIATVKDDRIVEAWNNFDFLAMYCQLGVLPMP